MDYKKEQLLEMTKKELTALCPRPPAKNYTKEQIANLVMALQDQVMEDQISVEVGVPTQNFTKEFAQGGKRYIKTYNAKGDSISCVEL